MAPLFSMLIMKKHPALVPVVAICGGACVMCAAYIGYMAASKGDLSFRPRSWSTEGGPYQKIAPTEVRKLYPHSTAIVVDPEIEKLKRELGSYKN